VVARELRDVLEPGLPGGPEPVDEDHRRALAGVDIVGVAPVDPHAVLVAVPGEVEPLRAPAPAIVAVRTRMQ
jgi:hypothetical protein